MFLAATLVGWIGGDSVYDICDRYAINAFLMVSLVPLVALDMTHDRGCVIRVNVNTHRWQLVVSVCMCVPVDDRGASVPARGSCWWLRPGARDPRLRRSLAVAAVHVQRRPAASAAASWRHQRQLHRLHGPQRAAPGCRLGERRVYRTAARQTQLGVPGRGSRN